MEASTKLFSDSEETVRLSITSIAATTPLSDQPIDLYENRMSLVREQFSNRSALSSQAMNPDIEPERLELFLICYSALGVAMTRPVEGWIHRAGRRCEQMGLKKLGAALRSHARQESGHHLMMIEDTRRLVRRWNSHHPLKLDADELIARSETKGVQSYIRLHEEVISGDSPFCQLAIEYEIEKLSVDFGPKWLAHCEKILGREILNGMSFVQEHVAVDEGHTNFNRKQLEMLLAERPEFAMPLVVTGEAALTSYDNFIADCLVLANSMMEQLKITTKAQS
jgi:hypothetical protein